MQQQAQREMACDVIELFQQCAKTREQSTNIEALAVAFRLTIERWPQVLAGLHGVYSEQEHDRTLILNEQDPEPIQRLTIAHAIAHAHYGNRDCCAIHHDSEDLIELNARYFAGHLLCPEEVLRPALDAMPERATGIIARLAVQFNIPYYLANWRVAESIGLFGPHASCDPRLIARLSAVA